MIKLPDPLLTVDEKLSSIIPAGTRLHTEQPLAPSDTAITYMTGYSDGREWAAAPIPQQQSVPEGWKLVPIEPTAEMCLAARQVPEPNKPYPPHFHLIWDAMLAAAPQPKETK